MKPQDLLPSYVLEHNARIAEEAEEEKETGMIRLEQEDFGTYLIVDEDTGKDRLVQVDYDYPSLASTFGWSPRKVVRKVQGKRCKHLNTDGTVLCRTCGATASMFIASATDYLDEHIGDTAEDPGYFFNPDCDEAYHG